MIGRFLNGAFENMRHAKLLRDLRQVFRRALETLRRCPRNDFKIRDLRQAGENFLLNAIAKIFLIACLAQIGKGQNGDGFFIG